MNFGGKSLLSNAEDDRLDRLLSTYEANDSASLARPRQFAWRISRGYFPPVPTTGADGSSLSQR
jgi:hypothetical protein